MKQWKFLVDGMKSEYDKSVWEIGVWREVKAPKKECVGLNASEYIQDALNYVTGAILAEVECGGVVIHSGDKSTWQRMRVIRAWEWGKNESVSLAVFSARQCLKNFEHKYHDDDRPRKAIEAAVNCSAAESAYSAAESAYSAAYSAAESAYSAAESAYSAAYSAAEKTIHEYIVSELIPKMRQIGEI